MTAQLLARMKREVTARRARLVVMLIPEPRLTHVSERFSQICKGAAVECVDPSDRFAASNENLVFPEDGHWNANGHRLAGRVLAEIVQAHR